jgi:hypothetical protein
MKRRDFLTGIAGILVGLFAGFGAVPAVASTPFERGEMLTIETPMFFYGSPPSRVNLGTEVLKRDSLRRVVLGTEIIKRDSHRRVMLGTEIITPEGSLLSTSEGVHW